MIDQISSAINKRMLLGERKQAIIVDLRKNENGDEDDAQTWQHAIVFLLRMNLPRVKVIDGFFSSKRNVDKDCGEEHLYLLSNKEQYAVAGGGGSGGGCSWKSLEPLCRLPERQITLYRVRR